MPQIRHSLLKFNAENYSWRAKGAIHELDYKDDDILIQTTTEF